MRQVALPHDEASIRRPDGPAERAQRGGGDPWVGGGAPDGADRADDPAWSSALGHGSCLAAHGTRYQATPG